MYPAILMEPVRITATVIPHPVITMRVETGYRFIKTKTKEEPLSVGTDAVMQRFLFCICSVSSQTVEPE